MSPITTLPSLLYTFKPVDFVIPLTFIPLAPVFEIFKRLSFVTFPLLAMFMPFAPVLLIVALLTLFSTFPAILIPPAPVLSINNSPVFLTVPVSEILIALPLLSIDNLFPNVLILPFTSILPASFLITA